MTEPTFAKMAGLLSMTPKSLEEHFGQDRPVLSVLPFRVAVIGSVTRILTRLAIVSLYIIGSGKCLQEPHQPKSD